MHAPLRAAAAILVAASAVTLCAPALGAHAAAASGNAGGGSAPRLMRVQHAHQPGTYRLRPGDYLSKVAARFCGRADAWPSIWRATGGIPDPDLVPAGLVVVIDCHGGRQAADPPARHYRHAAGKAWGVTYGYPNRCGDGDGDGWDMPCSQLHRHQGYRASSRGSGRAYSARASYSTAGESGFEACVIARESGGNAQVMNSSGHYGLYQFSESTWEAYGGSAASFGHASPAEQRRVFLAAIARGGQSNWSPYDGC